jgi:hypothetical protein
MFYEIDFSRVFTSSVIGFMFVMVICIAAL